MQGQGDLALDLGEGVAGDLLHCRELCRRVDGALLGGAELARLEGRGVGLAVGGRRADAEGQGFAARVTYCVAIKSGGRVRMGAVLGGLGDGGRT